MNNITNFKDIVGASNADQAHMLGKFLYFSLSNILVEKEPLLQLCEQLGIPYAGGKRISASDAFRSATGDIKDRLVIGHKGAQQIYAVYCRDNERAPDLLSRELVKETLNQKTNRYEKLANIYYDRSDNRFGYENIGFDADIDAVTYCQRAEELFALYQRCANRRQIETICQAYLRFGGNQGQLHRLSVFCPPAVYGEGGRPGKLPGTAQRSEPPRNALDIQQLLYHR